jgi:hypothetical protein
MNATVDNLWVLAGLPTSDYSIEIDEDTFFLGWYLYSILQIYATVYVYTWYIHGIYHKKSYLSIAGWVPDVLVQMCLKTRFEAMQNTLKACVGRFHN